MDFLLYMHFFFFIFLLSFLFSLFLGGVWMLMRNMFYADSQTHRNICRESWRLRHDISMNKCSWLMDSFLSCFIWTFVHRRTFPYISILSTHETTFSTTCTRTHPHVHMCICKACIHTHLASIHEAKRKHTWTCSNICPKT